MHVLIAVVDDLLLFARKALFGSVLLDASDDIKTVNQDSGSLVHADSFVEMLVKSPDLHGSSSVAVETSPALARSGEQCFIGDIGVFLYADPIISFDNTIGMISYGQSVQLIQLQGRWAQVRINDDFGWVFKDVLIQSSVDVYPNFAQGHRYTAEHADTVKLRACIQDEFGAGEGHYSLTSEEYIQYRLYRTNRVIQWGTERSRVAGTWQRKLRGKTGIHSAIRPSTDSIMEYIIDDIGHLAFVEAVYPDDSIKISEIGMLEDSKYTSSTLRSDQWKELSPVFITVA